jgi:iron complex outermembrane recepter protein
MRSHIVSGFAALTLCGALWNSLAGQSVGVLRGTVTNKETRAPVSGAVVALRGTDYRARANSNGEFVLSNVPAGNYILTVNAIGVAPYTSQSVDIRAGETTRLAVSVETSLVTLDQVQVTATKYAMSVGEVPALTNTVTEDVISHKGDVKLTQALTNVPGMINSALEGSFESVMLRGMPRTGNEWTSTLLLVDGIPQTDSRNSARVIDLPINDVSNIEVVRGPNSALYGSTAIGGVVNVLTAEPTSQPSSDFNLSGGTFDYFHVKAAASGPIQNWGGYYISGAGGQDHGFYKAPFLFKDKDQATYAKITFTPDSKSHGMISINNVVSDNGMPAELPVINGIPLNQLDPRVNLYQDFNLPSSNYHQEELRTAFNYVRDFSNRVSATEVFGWRRTKYIFQNDGDGVGAPFDTVAHTFTAYPFAEETDENAYYQEARLAIAPNLGTIKNSLLVGATYDYHSGFSSGNLIYTDTSTIGWPLNYLNPVPPPLSNWQYLPFGGSRYHIGTLGLYAQYTVAPLSRLQFVLGGRYDKSSLQNIKTFTSGQPRFTSSFDAFSPKISGTFKIIAPDSGAMSSGLQLNAYATYSGAFLPPRTPSSLAGSDTVPLLPEHIHNYEAGLKGDFASGLVAFDAGFFRMLDDGIVVDTRVGPYYFPSNGGKEDYRGVETSVSWTPIAALSLYANGAFYHNRFGKFVIQQSSGDVTLTGNRLPVSPDVVYNAGGRWQLPSGIGATVNLKHVGSSMLDQGNTFLLPAYTVTDASVFFDYGPALISISGHNLLNDKYFTMGDISAAQSIDPAQPRQIVVSTSLRFR